MKGNVRFLPQIFIKARAGYFRTLFLPGSSDWELSSGRVWISPSVPTLDGSSHTEHMLRDIVST